MNIWDLWGTPQRAKALSGTHIYHLAKLHVDRWHHHRDIHLHTHKETKKQTQSKLNIRQNAALVFVG